MDSSKLARLLYAFSSNTCEDKILDEIDISTQFPEDLQIPQAGYNCLHLSVMKKDVQLTEKLLSEGANLMKQGSHNGNTPLHVFIKSESFTKGKKIHELIGKLGKQQIINILLSEQVKRNITFNPKCIFGISHLHIACMVDNSEAVQLFLRAKECVNQVINANCSFFAGWAPLHIAVTYSSTETVKVLCYFGADIHLKDVLGKSPLHRVLKRQLDAMDNITIGKRAVITPIILEVKKLEIIICSLLVTRKRKKVNFIDEAGISAFHVACTIRNSSMVEDFLKHVKNVDINKPLNNNLIYWAGWTPLHFAACCSIETVKLLVQHGADITIKNTKGETPLDFCMRRYSPEIIHSILSVKEEFKEIVLFDQSIKLLDLILAMNDCGKFNNFLQILSDNNVIVPHDSPIWPGYSIFHLAISMHERTKNPEDYVKQLSDPEIFPKQYSCLEIEEKSYWKRIAVCLARQCNLTTKDINGMTPIHLAFKLHKANVVDKLLNCCRTNETDLNGLSFLHMACVIGKKNIVERFVNDIENPINSYFKWFKEKHLVTVQARSTALHIAVMFNRREIIEYLLQKNANVYAQDSLGFTPLHLSAFFEPIVYLFLAKTTDLKDVVSITGLSHLHIAVLADDNTAIEKLLKSGANVMSKTNIQFSKINYLDQTPLHFAVKMEKLKAVRALIQAGADIHATSSNSKYDTPLRGAMQMTFNEMTDEFVIKLRREKQTIGPIEACGVTLLHFACAVFDLKWAERLLNKGANPNAQICMDKNYDCEWKGYGPMHLLLARAFFSMKELKNLTDMVRLLLKHGADVTIQDDLGESPVLVADKYGFEEDSGEKCMKGNREAECKRKDRGEIGKKKKKEMIKKDNTELSDENERNLSLIADILLKHQRSHAINPTSYRGFSHFHCACKRNHVGIVNKFLQNGIDVNQATDIFGMTKTSGYTALHFALASRSFEVAELLLKHNADVKAKDYFNKTPLHIAASNNVNNVRLLETMRRMGADIKAKTVWNDTPLDLLIQSDFISSAELKFYFDRGCLLEFGEKEERNGTIGLLLRNGCPDDRETILKMLFKYCKLNEKIKNGFNAIQSFVSIPPGISHWPLDRYLGGIQLFMDLGCDVNQQNKQGKTALHSAMHHINVEAIQALLLLGADINITDYYTSNKSRAESTNLWSSAEYDFQCNRIRTILGDHVWKMKFVGLEIEKNNIEAAQKLWGSGHINIKLEERCKKELKKMAQMKIGEKWTMDDFLSESKIVIEYQTLSISQRQSIDKVFKSYAHLREMFPEFCGLLMLQYGKAVSKVTSCSMINDAIVSALRLDLPDDCLKNLLKYFDKLN